MSKLSDRERMLYLLGDQDGVSNSQLKSILNLTEDRYKLIISELLESKFVEKYRCRGGGIKITDAGYKELQIVSDAKSNVKKEIDLYAPFISALKKESSENEEAALIFDTSALRKRGLWSNPDVTKVSIRHYPILRKHEIAVFTYEVKQWGRWDTSSVYEAASHRRFAHGAYLVLEWAKDLPVEGLEEVFSICSRFGVGLITLHPYYKAYRHIVQLEAVANNPTDDLIEEYLGYVFQKQSKSAEDFNALWDKCAGN